MSKTSLDSRMTLGVQPERPHVFFDMDGTLTESRSLISVEMEGLLNKLKRYADVIIISGADEEQMMKQIPVLHFTGNYIMAQSGNHTLNEVRQMWKNELSDELIGEIQRHINYIQMDARYLEVTNGKVADTDDLVQLRGGQISFSLIGHNADKQLKNEFDPGGLFRQELIMTYPLEHEGIEVRVGGTTCLDYTKYGCNKAGNIQRLLQWRGWNADKCLYVGDAFHPGGNDEVMMGVLPTREVKGPDETMVLIEDLIKRYETI